MKRSRLYRTKSNNWIVPVLSVVVVILVFLLGFVLGRLGFNAAWESGEFTYTLKGSLYPEEKELDFNFFWEVWDMLGERYVDKAIDEQDMFYGAIKGLVSALDDPATVFYTPSETLEYEEVRSGRLEGIGIELAYENNEVIIKKTLEDFPAEKFGLIP